MNHAHNVLSAREISDFCRAFCFAVDFYDLYIIYNLAKKKPKVEVTAILIYDVECAWIFIETYELRNKSTTTPGTTNPVLVRLQKVP